MSDCRSLGGASCPLAAGSTVATAECRTGVAMGIGGFVGVFWGVVSCAASGVAGLSGDRLGILGWAIPGSVAFHWMLSSTAVERISPRATMTVNWTYACRWLRSRTLRAGSHPLDHPLVPAYVASLVVSRACTATSAPHSYAEAFLGVIVRQPRVRLRDRGGRREEI
jgi:hypothetical protein